MAVEVSVEVRVVCCQERLEDRRVVDRRCLLKSQLLLFQSASQRRVYHSVVSPGKHIEASEGTTRPSRQPDGIEAISCRECPLFIAPTIGIPVRL